MFWFYWFSDVWMSSVGRSSAEEIFPKYSNPNLKVQFVRIFVKKKKHGKNEPVLSTKCEEPTALDVLQICLLKLAC